MPEPQLAEDFLPVYDVSDAIAAVADTDRDTAWQALLDVDLLKLGREAPLVGMLGAPANAPGGRRSSPARRAPSETARVDAVA